MLDFLADFSDDDVAAPLVSDDVLLNQLFAEAPGDARAMAAPGAVNFLEALPEPSDSDGPPPPPPPPVEPQPEQRRATWTKHKLKNHYVAAKMRSAKAEKARASTINDQAATLVEYANNLRNRGRRVSLLHSVPLAKTKRNAGLRLVIRRAGLASRQDGGKRQAVTFEQMLEVIR